ncbi:MAG: sulfatase-like hydrolase/transferase, partial [Chitinophagaceae bacterium]|nr:sulfatase-like hydrolase/transferase [Chitinophagaceae bacterium]
DAYTTELIRKLNDTLRAASDRPRMLWVHISVPHEPFCRDSEGRQVELTDYGEKDSALIKHAYTEYLQYGNSIVRSLLTDHPELKDKIVIITGDHGPRYPFLQMKSFQTWPYAAARMPRAYDTAALMQLRYISQLPVFLNKCLRIDGGRPIPPIPHRRRSSAS